MKRHERERLGRIIQRIELDAEEALSVYEESGTVDHEFESRLQRIGILAAGAMSQVRRNRWSGSALLPWKPAKARRAAR